MSETKKPYSAVREHDGVYYVSGQLPIDPATNAMPPTIEEQTQVALQNVEDVLRGVGLDRNNVLKVTVFMGDFSKFSEMNGVYREFFEEPYPARSAFGVSGLVAGAMLEIEAIAAK